jgi:hypothetical protein
MVVKYSQKVSSGHVEFDMVMCECLKRENVAASLKIYIKILKYTKKNSTMVKCMSTHAFVPSQNNNQCCLVWATWQKRLFIC